MLVFFFPPTKYKYKVVGKMYVNKNNVSIVPYLMLDTLYISISNTQRKET